LLPSVSLSQEVSKPKLFLPNDGNRQISGVLSSVRKWLLCTSVAGAAVAHEVTVAGRDHLCEGHSEVVIEGVVALCQRNDII
jgi:hypothetical protein